MELAGNASHFPNPQHQLRYTFELLVYQAFAQVKTYITDEDINLAGVPALITVLETAFGNPVHMTIEEQKLEALKQTSHDFSTYYAEFLHYTTDVQWNDPAKCTALIRSLNNAIKNVLTISDNIPQ
jgi:hypothetical protein